MMHLRSKKTNRTRLLQVARGHPIVKLYMICLCHANLPCMSVCLCLGTAYHPSVTIGAPSEPQSKQRYASDSCVFLCPLSNWVARVHPIVKSYMECLYYANLPCMCLGTAYHPSVTMGAPVRAPKQAEIRLLRDTSFVHSLIG